MVLGAIALGFTWSSSEEIFANIRLFDRIALLVDQNYVENIDHARLVKAGIDGMLEKLDKYTKYLEGADFLQLQQATDGKIEGIGVYLEYHHDTLTVTSALEGTPGYKAGIQPGDKILKIDSSATTGMKIKDIRMLLKGKKGSPVKLLIERPGEGSFTVTAYRDEVEIESIPYCDLVSPEIGYIRLARFSEKCGLDLRKNIINLRKKGMKSLILDLRDNPGGLLSEAIEVASLFLPENSIIVETKGRDGALIASYAASGGPVFAEGDLAIIIDSQTASAAEIVAGAIQDHDRGVIIGGSSYGKGLVQQILMVGNESALKITTSRYHLPSGRCLQIPDWSTFELTVNGGKYYDTDSLYMTESGRPVFGGGGITPDIYVDEEDESEYVEALRREACFFDFATAYIRKNDVQPGFKIDDKIIAEFKEYIRDRDFRFEEQDRAAYNNLKNSVTFHDPESEKSLAVLDSRLRSREQSNFDSNYREVGEAIEEEVLLQKFGEKTLYQKWISEQPRIAAAIGILSSAQKYSSIFAQR